MSGWTTVHRDKRGKVLAATRWTSGIDKDATLHSISSQLEKHKKAWLEDSARMEVFKLLQHLHILDGEPIDRAICIGLGSLCRDNLDNRRRSMAQLVLFLDIVNHLQAKFDHPVQMYAQDPAFLDLDREFFRSMRIEILQPEVDPSRGIGQAVKHFGSNTFVTDFFMEKTATITKTFLTSDNRLMLSALAAHIDRCKGEPKQRTEGDELSDILDRSYARYDFPQSQGRDSLAYEGLQIMGVLPIDEDIETREASEIS